MRATKELYYDDDKKVLAPAPSSVNRLLLIAEAAEKCALLDPSALLKSDFVLSSLEQPDVDYGNDILIHENNPNNTSRKSLRVCCYGSSSSQTPVAYLQEAATLGFLLAIRGHTCVNGAGSFGCMAAMNDGAAAGNGHIVGVIHEMWLVDGAEKEIAENKDDEQDHLKREWSTVRPLRDGGAHRIFEQQQQQDDNDETASSSAAASATRRKKGGPRREMLVAGGKDLQQRKRLLVDKADALIVLPGGPGTWDELWEMACARNIGLTQLPIVCVNTNGYYEPFKVMLHRAWKDQLTKLEPHQILHFSETAQEAVQWVEEVVAAAAAGEGSAKDELPRLQKRSAALRKASVLNSPVTERNSSSSDDFSLLQSIRRSLSNVSDYVFFRGGDDNEDGNHYDATTTMTRRRAFSAAGAVIASSLVFAAGVVVGVLLSIHRQGQPSLGRISQK